MKMNIGGNIFSNVQIPLLWGGKAILQDENGGLSIIDLNGKTAMPQIIGNEPAENVEYKTIPGGVVIEENDGIPGLEFYAEDKIIKDPTGKLPECEISTRGVRVGGSFMQSNMVVGAPVGIVVDETGLGIGAPLPPGLAKLSV